MCESRHAPKCTKKCKRRKAKLTVETKVNNVVVEVLIDTGAELNVISKDMVIRLKGNIDTNDRISVGLAGNANINTLGAVKFRLFNRELKLYVVEKLAVGVIIGWPSLRKMGISIKVKEDIEYVKVADEVVKLVKVEEVKKKEEVRLEKSIKVEAGQQRLVRVVTNNSKSSYFVTPSQVMIDNGLKVGIGEVVDNRIFISNFTGGSITLKKGALVGYATRGEYIIYNLDEIDDENIFIPVEEERRGMKKDELISSLKDMGIIGEADMKEKERTLLEKLLGKWSRLFASNNAQPGTTTKTRLSIKFKDSKVTPVRERPRRVPVRALEELRRQVRSMIEGGVIEKSESAWAFPVVLAIKPDGTWRFCVDYSKLNDMVVKDSYPIPNVEEYIDQLKDAKYLSVIDLASGFWQVPVEEEDKEKLSFVTSFGTYKFNVMPFGFVNSPGVFQRAIAETLDPVLFRCALVYVDDVIIYSNSYNEHIRDLEEVFGLLSKYNWSIKLKKCMFGMKEVTYLGHKIGNGVMKPMERNIDKLRAMKVPSSKGELVSFLGVTGYYKKFIKGYDYIVKPLRDLVRDSDDKEKFDLNSEKLVEEKKAYEELLVKLSSEPVLFIYDSKRETKVKSDCSAYAWGAVLVQVDDDGLERPVAFASGSLNSSQRNWPTWKREMYGSMKAIEKWRHYLLGVEFILVTDHKANVYLMDPLQDHAPMINNWKIVLSQYKYKVIHRPGVELVIEDSLSRSPSLNNINESSSLGIDINSIIECQKNNSVLSEVRKYVDNNKYQLSEEVLEKVGNIVDNFMIENDILYYITSLNNKTKNRKTFRIAVSEEMVVELFKMEHNLEISGHRGFIKVYEKMSANYWAIGMYKLVKSLHEECHECRMSRISRRDQVVSTGIVASKPFEILEMDHIDVMVEGEGGYKYILSVVDVFTGKVWFLPTKSKEASETYEVLYKYIFSPFMFPKYLYSDLGGSFKNELDERLCKATGMKHEFTLANSLGHTGSVENKNKVVEVMLSKYIKSIDQVDWPRYVFSAAHAYNKSISSVSNSSPDEILFGMTPFSIVDLVEIDEEGIREDAVREWIKSINEGRRRIEEILSEVKGKRGKESKSKSKIREGVYVLLSQREVNYGDRLLNKKLALRNIGPYKVISVDNERNRVVIEITPSIKKEVKKQELEYYGEEYVRDEDKYYNDLKEIIILKTDRERVYEKEERVLSDKDKVGLSVKELVGRRVSVYEPKWRKWYKGVVIGYNNKLTKSLIQYDEKTIDKNGKEVDRKEDFYSFRLVNSNRLKKGVRWSLLGDKI